MTSKLTLITTLFISFIPFVHSGHFLGGTINWRIQSSSANSSMVAILITQTYSWTYAAGRCDNGAIANRLPVSGALGSLSCVPSCPMGFGSVSAIPLCTDVSPLSGLAIGQRSDTVIIPSGSDFSVVYTSSAWGGLTLGGGAWSITSHIELQTRTDNGMFNNAPIATIMSPINIEINKRTAITVSVSDPDGDIVRCRWARTSIGLDECGSVCPPGALPAGTVIHPNCTIEITGTISGSRFAVALMAEDFINSTSTIPLSSVPVQFLVQVIPPPACTKQPEVMFTGSSCTPIKVNETFTSQLLGVNHCGENATIIDIATLSFSGMVQGPLTKLSSLIYFKTITWTPEISQLGYQIMCAMALDSQYVQSPQYCFTFYVTENGTDTCPGVVNNLTTTTPPLFSTVAPFISTTTPMIVATSNCVVWPWFVSFGILTFLAMLCNFCLLWHYYRLRSARHRRDSYINKSTGFTGSAPSTIRTNSSVVPFDSKYASQNEKNRGRRVPRLLLGGETAGHLTQRNDTSNPNQPKGISLKNVSKDLDRSASSLNLHPDLSLNKSRSLPLGTNQNRVRGASDPTSMSTAYSPTFPRSIESGTASSNSDRSLMDNNIYLQSYQSLPVERINSQGMSTIIRNSLSPHIYIEYVPRPK